MNVGYYVRTKEFGINRIKWFDNEEPILENGFTALQNSGYKSSPNIIELIEVGDYVNGSLVSFVGTDSIEVFWYKDEKQWLDKEDIKTIVTHEQMEAMQYRVEG
jgi:hypothetical protein